MWKQGAAACGLLLVSIAAARALPPNIAASHKRKVALLPHLPSLTHPYPLFFPPFARAGILPIPPLPSAT